MSSEEQNENGYLWNSIIVSLTRFQTNVKRAKVRKENLRRQIIIFAEF
jgi:hypothetical protein